MKKIILILFVLVSFAGKSQVLIGADGKIHSGATGGTFGNSNEVTVKIDTTSTKNGFSVVGGNMYYGNGTWYTLCGGNVGLSIVPTIPALEGYSTPSTIVIVSDSLRGGVFVYSATGKPDSVTVFNRSGGGFWLRQYNNSFGVNVNWAGAKGDSSTDATNAIQLALNTNAGKIYFSGKFVISSPLTMHSNQKIDFDKGSMLVANASFQMLQNYATVVPNRTLTDGTCNASSDTIYSATANFIGTDVGRAITLKKAGYPQTDSSGLKYADPTHTDLYGHITQVVNSTTALIDINTTWAVTNQPLVIYNIDSCIEISGGNFIKGQFQDMGVKMRRINNLKINGSNFKSWGNTAGGNYAISVADCNIVNIQDINFSTYSDGIHLTGCNKSVNISNISGRTGDDFIGITTRDWPNSSKDSLGEIYGTLKGLNVSNIYGASLTGILRLEGAYGTILQDIDIEQVNCDTFSGGVILSDDQMFGNATIKNISFKNIQGYIVPTGRTPNLFSFSAYYVENVIIRDCKFSDSLLSSAQTIFGLGGANGTIINGILVDNCVSFAKNVNVSFLASSSYVYVKNAKMTNNRLYAYNNGYFSSAFSFFGGNDDIIFSNNSLVCANTNSQTSKLLQVSGSNPINSIELSNNIHTSTGVGGNTYNFSNASKISNIKIVNDNVNYDRNFTASNFFINPPKNITNSLQISNTTVNYSGNVIQYPSGDTINSCVVSNFYSKYTSRFSDMASSLDITLSNVAIDTCPNPGLFYVYGTNTLTVRGAGVRALNNWTGVQRSGTQTVRVINPDFPCDLFQLSKNLDDIALNTNTSYKPAGVYSCNGNTWVKINNDSLALHLSDTTYTGTGNVLTQSKAASLFQPMLGITSGYFPLSNGSGLFTNGQILQSGSNLSFGGTQPSGPEKFNFISGAISIWYTSASSETARFATDGSTVYIENVQNGDVVFRTNGYTQRGRIKGGGNWIIGPSTADNNVDIIQAAGSILSTAFKTKYHGSGVFLKGDGSFDSTINNGVYVPTISNTTNVTSSTADSLYWIQTGNVVTISGNVLVLATGAGTTILDLNIPVASAHPNAKGVCTYNNSFASSSSAGVGGISYDTTNSKPQLTFYSPANATYQLQFEFKYYIR